MGDYMNNELDLEKIPNHIAIILDGNGRWAQKRGMPRTFGHRKGAFNIRDIATESNKLKIKYLTLFCFSTENWNRPESEVKYIMTAPIRYLKRYYDSIVKSTIRIKLIGRRDRFSKEFLETVNMLEDGTKDHKGLTLIIAFDYGSYDEITNAVKKIAMDYKDNKIAIDDIDEKMIENNLYTAGFPPLDLLIRTSGEQRISNFLLWQLAYSELYFTPTFWPDFDKKELHKAIIDFQSRNRRYGGLTEDKK